MNATEQPQTIDPLSEMTIRCLVLTNPVKHARSHMFSYVIYRFLLDHIVSLASASSRCSPYLLHAPPSKQTDNVEPNPILMYSFQYINYYYTHYHIWYNTYIMGCFYRVGPTLYYIAYLTHR